MILNLHIGIYLTTTNFYLDLLPMILQEMMMMKNQMSCWYYLKSMMVNQNNGILDSLQSLFYNLDLKLVPKKQNI